MPRRAVKAHLSARSGKSSTAFTAPIARSHADDIFSRRALSESQQKSYIDAVLCLQDIPAKSGFDAAKNRFDDFQAIHSNQTPAIHWVVCHIQVTES